MRLVRARCPSRPPRLIPTSCLTCGFDGSSGVTATGLVCVHQPCYTRIPCSCALSLPSHCPPTAPQDFAKENDMDFEKERAAFGEWIASYLDDAGYHSWIRFSFIYKTMIMTAFPPLEDLDNRKGNLDKKTMQEFEQAMITWLEVFDRFNDGAKSVSKLEASITNPGKFGFRV